MAAMSGQKKGRIRGVLFDKDGTLIDFKSQWMPAYRAAASHAAGGVSEMVERLLKVAGYDPLTDRVEPTSPLACGTTGEIARIWASGVGRATDAVLIKAIGDIFHDFATRAPQPVTDLSGLFSRLHRRGIAIGVATMDATATADANLSQLGIAHLVDFVAGWDRGLGVKPDPGMVLAFCKQAQALPVEIAVVGDSILDLTMGRSARVGLVVGVLTGVTPREVLAPLADHVIDSIASFEVLLD
jgi:phosphoglycolate phosphatase